MQKQKNAQSIILSCTHLSKKFEDLEVLKDVSFTVHKGEKIGLVGPNGSGKSTLLKIIAGEIKNDSGSVTFGQNIKIEYFPQVRLSQDEQSGGEIAKKILAPIMASSADLFLLDEPTNDLDEDGLSMVEKFVTGSDKSFLIISHDRMFLDKTVSKIIEIDETTRTNFIYDGGYSDYAIEKLNKIERQWKNYSDKAEKQEKLQSTTKQKDDWVREIEKKRKNIKKLAIHEKEKPNAADLRDAEARASRRAVVMKRKLERFVEKTKDIEKPKRLLPLHIDFETTRGSTIVFELKDVVKKIGDKEIGPFNFVIQYGQRLHITGPNGSGKSTLIKMLLSEIKNDSGNIKIGNDVTVGYIPQERSKNLIGKNPVEHFLNSVSGIPETDARKILNRFRINGEDVKKDISQLSPGEYSRLLIAELVAKKPNCIILDEPSNHLDLEVLEELESGLVEYKGTLIVVSHDRYMTEKLNLEKSIYIEKC